MDEIKGQALGCLNMSEEEFETMEVGTFMLKLFFANKQREDDKKFLGDVIRRQTLWLVNVQLSEQSQLKKPEQLWQYAWEVHEGKPAKEITLQDQQQMIKELRETAMKHLNGR